MKPTLLASLLLACALLLSGCGDRAPEKPIDPEYLGKVTASLLERGHQA